MQGPDVYLVAPNHLWLDANQLPETGKQIKSKTLAKIIGISILKFDTVTVKKKH